MKPKKCCVCERVVTDYYTTCPRTGYEAHTVAVPDTDIRLYPDEVCWCVSCYEQETRRYAGHQKLRDILDFEPTIELAALERGLRFKLVSGIFRKITTWSESVRKRRADSVRLNWPYLQCVLGPTPQSRHTALIPTRNYDANRND